MPFLDLLGAFKSLYSFSITMSSTITNTTTSLSVLADYEVHHSGEETETVPVNTSLPQSNQPDWPTHHRRIPAYRPANRELDYTQRPAGNGHPAEYAFIQVMLHGCWLNAVCTHLPKY
jgi:hypothetical protein